MPRRGFGGRRMILSRRAFWILIGLLVLPMLLVLGLDHTDIDSSQFAEIGREMAVSGDFWRLRENGRIHMDKPILAFWNIAFSLRLFGINNFGYRFPVLVFTLLSLLSLYRLARLSGDSVGTARTAVVAYAAAPGMAALYLDPKIDVYLTAFLIFTFHAYYLGTRVNPHWYYLMYAFVGLGFITKGPIAAVVPGLAIGGDILLRRDWDRLKSLRLPSGVLIAAVPPVVWSIMLYYDVGSWGPYYFLWLQSFGRFYANDRTKFTGHFRPGALLGTFSWAFLPFLGILLARVGMALTPLFSKTERWPFLSGLWTTLKHGADAKADYVLPLYLFLTLGLLNFAQFQMPQYVYWLLPGAAILAARYVSRTPALARTAGRWGIAVSALAICIYIAIPVWVVDATWTYVLPFLAVCGAFVLLRAEPRGILLPALSSGLLLVTFVELVYPDLLRYQPSSAVGRDVQRLEPHRSELYTFLLPSRSYPFYANRLTKGVLFRKRFVPILEEDGPRLLIVRSEHRPYLDQILNPPGSRRILFTTLAEYPNYQVAKPKRKFLMKRTRPSAAGKLYLLRAELAPLGSSRDSGAHQKTRAGAAPSGGPS